MPLKVARLLIWRCNESKSDHCLFHACLIGHRAASLDKGKSIEKFVNESWNTKGMGMIVMYFYVGKDGQVHRG
jgi:hypothetical protein